MKEQSEKLFRAIGDVGDDLIAQADAPVKKAPRVWVKWAALAACCALVIGAAAFVVPGADCFTVVPESVTRTSADFTLTNEEDAVLALRSEYWLETLTDGEWQPLTSNLMKSQSQTDESALESTVCTLHYDWQTLYGEVEPGDYRLAQPVILPDGSDYTLYAEFTIE